MVTEGEVSQVKEMGTPKNRESIIFNSTRTANRKFRRNGLSEGTQEWRYFVEGTKGKGRKWGNTFQLTYPVSGDLSGGRIVPDGCGGIRRGDGKGMNTADSSL